MGDRASIELVYPRRGKFRPREKSVWIYTHWGATDFPQTLADVLERHDRWDDETYLARMIASRIFDNAGIHESTGAGIAPEYQDGVKWRIHLELKTIQQPGGYGGDSPLGQSYTYEEFLAAVAADHSFEYGEDD